MDLALIEQPRPSLIENPDRVEHGRPVAFGVTVSDGQVVAGRHLGDLTVIGPGQLEDALPANHVAGEKHFGQHQQLS